MESAIPQGRLAEIVRVARERTGVPAVAAGLLVDGEVELAAAGPVEADTPFRVASITKWFTASLAAAAGLGLDPDVRRFLSHTAGLRTERAEQLPEACRGLWSYANSGYWAAGDAIEAATGASFSEAMRERLLEPLELGATSFDEPADAAEGHVQDGAMGHRPTGRVEYPVSRRPSGGLWSTAGDLLRFAAHQLGGPGPLSASQLAALHEPEAQALGAEYCLGCWRRELDGDRIAYDHEGSVAGFQSLLLVVPEDRLALAVLTNSWRGSGLIRRVIRELGLIPASSKVLLGKTRPPEPGRYALGDAEALVEERDGTYRVSEAETDPLSGRRIERPALRLEPLGGAVYGIAGGLLMSHRADFPRPGVARVGWVALPRAEA
jgi:CubicO group peptidase (beta-lactamase class C family)